MTPMLEKAARAAMEASPSAGREPGSHLRSQPLPIEVCRDLVRAVLSAIRVPDEETLADMWLSPCLSISFQQSNGWSAVAEGVFRAGIDSILNESEAPK